MTAPAYSLAEMQAAYPSEACTPSFSHAGSRGIARATQGAETSPQAAEFRRVLGRHAERFSLAIPVAIGQAKQGERYGMMCAIIARLARAGWPIADIRAVLLPHVVAAWTDTPADVLGRQVDSFAAWVLGREGAKVAAPVTERAARIAKAFGAGQ